jgi:cytochrome c-type biogenesis protein
VKGVFYMKRLLMIIAVLGLVTALAACGEEPPGEDLNPVEETVESTEVAEEAVPAAEEAEEEAEEERMPAIDFTLMDWQGNETSLSDYKGEIVFLNFFATWCPPCQAEMPEFEEASIDYEGEVTFLIVDVYTGEKAGTSVQDVKDWYSEGGFTMPMVIDEEGVLNDHYPVRAFPTTFVIDEEGGVVGYLEGAMTREMVDQVIAQVKGE